MSETPHPRPELTVAPGRIGVAGETLLLSQAAEAIGLAPSHFRRLWRAQGFPLWGSHVSHQRITMSDWKEFERKGWSG